MHKPIAPAPCGCECKVVVGGRGLCPEEISSFAHTIRGRGLWDETVSTKIKGSVEKKGGKKAIVGENDTEIRFLFIICAESWMRCGESMEKRQRRLQALSSV